MNLLAHTVTAALTAMVSEQSLAQQTPFPPTIRFVVPFTPGAGTDVMARAVAAQLGARIGSTVIVENRGGAMGQIATSSVAKGPRDGSLLLFTTSSLVTSAATSRNLPYNLTKDLVPIAIVSNGPMLVGVSAKSGIKTPADLIGAATLRTEGLNFSSGGVGSAGHLAAELLNEAGKIQLRHIPYKGVAPALIDLAAANVDVLIASYSSMASQIQSGKVLPIAVTSSQRSAAYPGIPTMCSAAPGYSVGIWYGLVGPSSLPADIVNSLNHEVNEIATSPELRKLTEADGGLPILASPAELARLIDDDYKSWKRLAAQKNIVVEY